MSVIKIKGCPFCGGEPNYSSRQSESTLTGELHILSCMCGGFGACAHKTGDTRGAVIDAWNRRSSISMETGQELAEALEFVSKFDDLGSLSEGLIKAALSLFNEEKATTNGHITPTLSVS